MEILECSEDHLNVGTDGRNLARENGVFIPQQRKEFT